MQGPIKFTGIVVITLFFTLLSVSPAVQAHCDTLDGPVVVAAQKALEKGDVTPVLQWVKKEHEGEIRTAFQKTLVVRGKGAEAKEMADLYFFETLVRLHRAGEGAPYTGLSRETVEPIIAAADQALEKGSVDHLVKHVTEAVASGIRLRFAQTYERKKHAEESISAGREFVEAYVEFTHYVERLFNDAMGQPAALTKPEESGAKTQHKH